MVFLVDDLKEKVDEVAKDSDQILDKAKEGTLTEGQKDDLKSAIDAKSDEVKDLEVSVGSAELTDSEADKFSKLYRCTARTLGFRAWHREYFCRCRYG